MLRFAILVLVCLDLPNIYTADDTSFKVSVVEYNRSTNVTLNLEKYTEAIKNSDHVDFIIFPELSLSNAPIEIPDKTQTENCFSVASDDLINVLACLAKEKEINLIINVPERVNCSVNSEGCGPRGYLKYNTDVVFGKNGSIIGRYRKFNLFGEEGTNTTEKAEVVVIETDKGNFGIFTCFDIAFHDPSMLLIKLGVRNFFYPTLWHSELPFSTALQAQQMWSYGNNVNFFSSGSNRLNVGSGGTGIFLGERGPLNLTISPNLTEGEYEILTSNVSGDKQIFNINVNETDEDIDNIARMLDNMQLFREDLSEYTSELLDISQSTVNRKICDNNSTLCCFFNLSLRNNTVKYIDKSNHYIYRLVAFSGVRSFSGKYNGGVEVCAIISCLDSNSISSCNQRFTNYNSIVWPTIFETIDIAATIENHDMKMQFPNSLLSSLRPISPEFTTWNRTVSDKTVDVSFSLNKPQSRLHVFAIYGRDYSQDKPNNYI